MKNCTPYEKAFTGAAGKVISFTMLLLLFLTTRSLAYFTPVINTNPSPVTVCQGSTTSFTVGATGTGLTYQWQVFSGGSWNNITNNSQYSNATTAILTVTGINSGMNGLQYRCNVSDGAVVSSGAATLTVNGNTAPTVWTTNQQTPICLAAGTSALGAQPSTATSYQWQFSTDGGVTWSNTVDGSTYTNSLSTDGNLFITLASSLSGTLYHYIATAANGCSATSAIDTLYVLQPVIAPPATANYVPVTGNTALIACPGSNTPLNVTATGASGLTYQWMLGTGNLANNSTYSGVTTPNLTITGVTTGMNSSRYKVVVTDASTCSVTSGTITLTVPVVSVTTAPANTNVCAGSNAVFTPVVSATGGTPTRQWQTDNGTTAAGGPVVWANVAGGTSATLTLSGVTMPLDGFRYRVNVTSAGSCNTATSADAILHVATSGTWLGGVDTNWHVAGNWCGGVPISTTDVLVPNWAPRMPTISPTTATAFWQSIKIENTAGLRITGGSYPFNLAPAVYNLPGTVSYIADADQNILPATHGSLTIGGSFNKLLQTNTDITHTLTLGGSAKLVTGTNILTMKAGSNSIVNAAFFTTASSWIVTGNGLSGAANTGLGGLQVEQVSSGSGAVIYPIGPTTVMYNPVNLTNSGATDNFRMRVNDQPLPGSVANSGVSRSWFIDEQTPGGSLLALNLQWSQPEEQSGYVQTSSQIIRSDGSAIVQYTPVLPVSGGNPYATGGGAFSALTQFSVASYTLVLPIRLNDFAARRTGALNQIDWQAGGQEQPSQYILERSADGIGFNEIASVSAVAGKTSYIYADHDPGNAVTYYRLKMPAGDNKNIFYSRTVSVTNQQGVVRVELRPSVVNGNETSLFIILPQKTNVSCTLTDVIGRVQRHISTSLEKGAQTIPLHIGGLAKGIYYLRITGSDGIIKLLPLVKQ